MEYSLIKIKEAQNCVCNFCHAIIWKHKILMSETAGKNSH